MTIKQTLTSKIQHDMGVLGLADCCQAVIEFIARQKYPGDLYLSLSDFKNGVESCSGADIERAVNYFCSSKDQQTILKRSYCFLDERDIIHELDQESVEVIIRGGALYHPDTGRSVDQPLQSVFVLYKANLDKVVE